MFPKFTMYKEADLAGTQAGRWKKMMTVTILVCVERLKQSRRGERFKSPKKSRSTLAKFLAKASLGL